jgi:hypothetical protein
LRVERLKERKQPQRPGTTVRDYAVRDHAGLSHAEIAALFGMPSSNSVAQTMRRPKTHKATPPPKARSGRKDSLPHLD